MYIYIYMCVYVCIWYCHWTLARLYIITISIICLDYVQRTSVDLMKENGLARKKPEANDIPLKTLRMQIMQMI